MSRTTAGVAAAVIGGLIKLSGISDKFPHPFNLVGYAIIFVGVVLIALDFMDKGIAED